MPDSPDSSIVRAGAYAMATRFEIALAGAEPERLRAAAEAALEEVSRAESMLSPFIASSEISAVNSAAGIGCVKVSGQVFGLLQLAREVWERTGGAFDLTVGPLMRLWGFRSDEITEIDSDLLRSTQNLCGMHHLRLDADRHTAELDVEGAALDLGALGKGFAVAAACKVLEECGVRSALVHGGASSICAIGAPPRSSAWRVAIRDPFSGGQISVVDLNNASLSVSATHGRQTEHAGETMGHVLDPRTGRPARVARLAAVVSGASAALGDALSTALLVLGEDGIDDLESRYPGAAMMVALEGGGIRASSRWGETATAAE